MARVRTDTGFVSCFFFFHYFLFFNFFCFANTLSVLLSSDAAMTQCIRGTDSVGFMTAIMVNKLSLRIRGK